MHDVDHSRRDDQWTGEGAEGKEEEETRNEEGMKEERHLRLVGTVREISKGWNNQKITPFSIIDGPMEEGNYLGKERGMRRSEGWMKDI